MKVYISGPISGRPLAQARREFDEAVLYFMERGDTVVNPFNVAPHHTCTCPDAASDAGAGSSHLWCCYLRGDLAALLDCDAIAMLSGWNQSHGARLELQVASAVGIEVIWILDNW